MTPKKRPLILITNDDGIHAKGIRALIQIMQKIGDVVVMAPEEPMSGMSHSITSLIPLRARLIEKKEFYQEYACAGTPVDCVKLAQHLFFQEQKPDLVVSGINHGSNASINIIYSGTMGAALESSMNGFPSIGFSLLDYSKDADFLAAEPFILQIVEDVLRNDLPKNVCLNVNIPAVKTEEIKGIRICRQANACWVDSYENRIDPRGHNYFWLTGDFKANGITEEDDIWALDNNYISVVPVQYDFTHYECIDNLKGRLENV